MKRNRAAAGLAGCGLLALGIVLSFIMFLRQRESVSVASMEPVRLEVCFLEDEEAYTGEQVTGILPGETVKRGTAVILDGTSPEAYIRVGLTFGGILGDDAGEGEKVRLERIRELQDGISFETGWLKGSDGFYYYQKKVAPGSIVPVYSQVTIPENWENDIAEKVFTIELGAEAVRSEHLEPWLLDGQAILSWEEEDP